jgi:hypothetical protein
MYWDANAGHPDVLCQKMLVAFNYDWALLG